MRRLEQIPGLHDVGADLQLEKPQLDVTIDREKAATLGISAREIATTLSTLLAGQDVSRYRQGSERYDVIVQLAPEYRTRPEDLGAIAVRTRGGALVPLRTILTVKETIGPNALNHYNRGRSVEIGANLDGITLADAIRRSVAAARDVLPPGVTISLSGESREFSEGAGNLQIAFLLALLMIYLALAGQFESFVHPFTIMLAVPLGMLGGVGALWGLGMTLNVNSVIGLIMLMGLVTKNSILLVDFTLTLQRRGWRRDDALREAGVLRLRPILMTAFSTILGVLPIALAVGAGSVGRRPLGVAVAAGMTVSTVLTLIVVPVFYTLVADLGRLFFRRRISPDVSPEAPPDQLAEARRRRAGAGD
jgi:multidrug efflux pump